MKKVRSSGHQPLQTQWRLRKNPLPHGTPENVPGYPAERLTGKKIPLCGHELSVSPEKTIKHSSKEGKCEVKAGSHFVFLIGYSLMIIKNISAYIINEKVRLYLKTGSVIYTGL